jgi:BirA family biotin operon repressor/biotin-[acetyl-CoA-carboxylase] ligase
LLNPELSPQLVEQFVTSEHHNRSPDFTKETVHDIFRFGAPIGHSIESRPTACRCMDLARSSIYKYEQSGKSFNSGSAIFAEQLTGGKGRFQRQWHAPKGGIWMVLTLVNTMLPEHAAFLPIAAGVSCCETVRHFGLPARIKWVNDVHVGGKKLAGVLTETVIGPESGEEYILIGIGLNVNNLSFPENLSGIATSMTSFLGEKMDLTEVSAMLLAKLSWNIGLLHYHEHSQLQMSGSGSTNHGKNPLLKSWCALSDTIGRQVKYGFNVAESPQYLAKVLDVDDSGALIMELKDGTIAKEAGGEIMYV